MPKHLSLVLLSFLLAACNLGSQPAALTPSPSGELPAAEQTTPTAAAAIALVNGESISSASYNAHLAQYQAAQAETGTLLATDGIEQIVLDDLIGRVLLAQGARAAGFAVTDGMVEERLSRVLQQAGGQVEFDAWLAEQSFSAELFKAELELEIEAGEMRKQITEAVPLSAEQVLARQLLVADLFQAERLLGQLNDGTSFEVVVQNNDPQRLGTLGWFPRGYLLQPAIEEAAFALQPGEYSQIIETPLGFHIVEVIERSADRPLSAQARLALQMKALNDWVATQRSQSAIEIYLP
jgi:peptidyl-prolyl cis-trans isomerase C